MPLRMTRSGRCCEPSIGYRELRYHLEEGDERSGLEEEPADLCGL
jgi:hypothetical protein